MLRGLYGLEIYNELFYYNENCASLIFITTTFRCICTLKGIILRSKRAMFGLKIFNELFYYNKNCVLLIFITTIFRCICTLKAIILRSKRAIFVSREYNYITKRDRPLHNKNKRDSILFRMKRSKSSSLVLNYAINISIN